MLGINVLVFILVFLLIDRTDESQLVRYSPPTLTLALALTPTLEEEP